MLTPEKQDLLVDFVTLFKVFFGCIKVLALHIDDSIHPNFTLFKKYSSLVESGQVRFDCKVLGLYKGFK